MELQIIQCKYMGITAFFKNSIIFFQDIETNAFLIQRLMSARKLSQKAVIVN